MNAVHTEAETEKMVVTKKEFRFPHGILGFENIKDYCLYQKKEESPFFWLQMLDEPELSFLLVPSVPCFPDYKPDLAKEDLSLLQIQNPEKLMMFNIVTLHPGGGATANLKGPVILNTENNVGAQFVINNAADYAVNQSLSA
jgi:flagellar assembly factor FliW